MVLDFGFLKEEMMNEIDAPCDHGTCLWVKDPVLHALLGLNPEQTMLPLIEQSVHSNGYWLGLLPTGKTYVVPFVPTAENLAKHWYDRLLPRIVERTDGKASLARVDVWETPNCSASYGG
jgi:6-pyruvoyltetrahydropterin/6-carboxytetrahydropterin synthase